VAYISNGLKFAAITIAGTDFTDSFISFQCADSSADRRGIISTKGSITLTWSSNFNLLNEYRRKIFLRGNLVTIDLQKDDGTIVRHPRGYLYVITNSYNPENDTLTIEVGCKLALLELSTENDVSSLLQYISVPLSPELQTFNNISAVLALEGKILYQNKNGSLIQRSFFINSLEYGAELSGQNAAKWVSVLGTTLLAASPISTTEPLPDALAINYSLPTTEGGSFENIQIDETTTNYYIRFPMKIYTRIPPSSGVAGLGISGAFAVENNYGSGDCGNNPTQPDGNNGSNFDSCTEGFVAEDYTEYLYVTKTNTQISRYYGVGGQLSEVEQVSYGPALEVNSQYYTDKYAYCVASFSSRCNLTGSCRATGDRNIFQGKSITTYTYNADGSVKQTVTENYQNIGYAAQPTDWRSTTEEDAEGTLVKRPWEGGAFEARMESGEYYLDSKQIDDYEYFNNGTRQTTTSYASVASEGIGIKSYLDLDATQGIKTVQIRTSSTLSINPDAPERNTGGAQLETTEEVSLTPIIANTYITPPSESQEFVVQEQLPIDVLSFYENDPIQVQREKILQVVEKYKQYLILWIKGNTFGLNLSENLREEIVSNWVPGVPFYYYDPIANEAFLACLDAGSWAIDKDSSVVTFKAVFLGNVASSFTYFPGDNTTGSHVRPVHPEDPAGTPGVPGISTPPSILGANILESGSIVLEIKIEIGLQAELASIDEAEISIIARIQIIDLNPNAEHTIYCLTSGQIVQPGGLIAVEGAGGIPISADNILLTVGANVLQTSLFG